MRVIGIAGWSGSGKTTLLTKLIPELRQRGLTVSTLKHAHHAFDVDQPGKDSYAHREAGATEVLIVSKNRFALMHELRDQPEPRLHELFAKLALVDLVLVEGFKTEAHRKIEVFRAANAKPPLYPDDAQIVAIASDVALADAGRPVIDFNDVSAIADCVIAHAEPSAKLVARLTVAHGFASAGLSMATT
ncbi:MAG: molybdopterin-guanine dinucleotide biosynthesis protein B [Bosea sp. (in: a-proteobacteria)]